MAKKKAAKPASKPRKSTPAKSAKSKKAPTKKRTPAKAPRKKKAPTKKRSRAKAPSKKKPAAVRAAPIVDAIEIMRWVGTQDQVATTFRVSRRTVAEWISAGMPSEHGRYDLLTIALWRLEKLRAREGDAELLKAQRRRMIAQADEAEESARKKRLANDTSERQLYHSDEIDLAAAELVLHIKTQLEAWPDQVRQQFGPEVALELDESVHQLLNVLAAWKAK